MADVTVVILTHNEAQHIARSIHCARRISQQIIVVDSFSSDDTCAIATDLGAEVYQHPFVNYAKQFQWALDHTPIRGAWVMRLDADEVIEDDLIAEINERLPTLPASVSGVNLDRKHVFMGRWVKHGGRYPLTLLRIWRRGLASIEDRWMDEHMVLSSGTSVSFRGGFADCNLNDLTFFTAKHNKYATREAIDVLLARRGILADRALSDSNSPAQAASKRQWKERVFNQLPFYVGPTLYFLYRMTWQRGFLDGKEGLIYHFLQGFWYRFLVGAKIVELERVVADAAHDDDFLARLTQATGHELRPRPAVAATSRDAVPAAPLVH